MTQPRGVTNREALSSRAFGGGEKVRTELLNVGNTIDYIVIGNPKAKLSFQRSGDLQANVSFSINGKDYFDSTAVTDATPASYATHAISYIKVERTLGEGRMSFTMA